MKKVFVVALAAMLVAAFAVTAMAETKVSFNGYYRVRGFVLNNFNLSDESANEDSEKYFNMRFQFGAKFKPSDALTLNVRGRALNNTQWSVGRDNRDVGSFYLDRVYMDIKTSFGLFQVGRMSGGTAGLAVAGHGGSPVGMDRCIFDAEEARDRLKYTLVTGPFGLIAVYEKMQEVDSGVAEADGDEDRFGLLPFFKFANGQANVLLYYIRNHTATILDTPQYNTTMWIVDPALQLNFGPFQLNVEAQWANGKMEWKGPAGVDDIDLEGFGFYADGTWNYGSGQLGLMYNWVQGDDDGLANDKVENMVGAGGDFTPYLIAFDLGLGDNAIGGARRQNYWMVGLWVDHNLTENLLLHAAYAYMQVNKPGKKWNSLTDDASKNYGSEFDLGLAYKVMDNLNYTAVFGYFIPGDYHKETWLAGQETGNVWAFRHELRMDF